MRVGGRWHILALVLGCLTVGIGMMAGCRFGMGDAASDAAGVGALLSSTSDVRRTARVELAFQVRPDGVPDPRPTLRAEKTGGITVIARIVGIRVGHPELPLIVDEKRAVADLTGRVSLVFDRIAAVPSMISVRIDNAAIDGYRNFQGAEDLREGTNAVVVQPIGSRFRQDLAASVLQTAVMSSDTLRTAGADLTARARAGIGQMTDDEKGQATAYMQAFNRLLRNVAPPSHLQFAYTNERNVLQAIRQSAVVFERRNTELLAGVDLFGASSTQAFADWSMLRDAVDGHGFAGFYNGAERVEALLKVSATGERLAALVNPGKIAVMLNMPDGSVIIGANHRGLGMPVLARWDPGSASVAVVPLASGGPAVAGLRWVRFLERLTASSYNGEPNVYELHDDGYGNLISGFQDLRFDPATGRDVPVNELGIGTGTFVDLVMPAPGAVFNTGFGGSGFHMVVQASTTVAGARISRLEYYMDDVLLHTETVTEGAGNAPSQFVYQVQNNPSAGTHRLRVRAVDSAGTEGLSRVVQIRFVVPPVPPMPAFQVRGPFTVPAGTVATYSLFIQAPWGYGGRVRWAWDSPGDSNDGANATVGAFLTATVGDLALATQTESSWLGATVTWRAPEVGRCAFIQCKHINGFDLAATTELPVVVLASGVEMQGPARLRVGESASVTARVTAPAWASAATVLYSWRVLADPYNDFVRSQWGTSPVFVAAPPTSAGLWRYVVDCIDGYGQGRPRVGGYLEVPIEP